MIPQLSTLGTALRGIFAHKLRSILTILGVIIGIGAVIALTSVGEGSRKIITDRIGQMGSNLLTVQAGSSSSGFVRGEMGSGQTLTYEDALAIAASSEITAVEAVAPQASASAQVIAGGNNMSARIYGVTPEYEGVRNKRVSVGQFIASSDVESKASMCVLGSGIAEELFGEGANPVGETLKLGGRLFTVIGVLKSEGGMMGSDYAIVVPITTVTNRLIIV